MKTLDVFCPFLKIKRYIINLAYNTLNNCFCLPSLLQHQSISNLQALNLHHIGSLSIPAMEGVFFSSGILSLHFFLPCSTCIVSPAPICHYYFKVNTYALSSQNNSSGNISLTFRSLLYTVS